MKRVFGYTSFSPTLQSFVSLQLKQPVCLYMQMFMKNQGFTRKDHWHIDHGQYRPRAINHQVWLRHRSSDAVQVLDWQDWAGFPAPTQLV